MAGSLRDQLVKAGLASSSQAKKAERQLRAEEQAKRQGGKQQRKKKGAESPPATSKVSESKRRAQQQMAARAERDRAAAAERNKKAAAKALRAEIKQIILQNDQRAKATKAVIDDYVAYSFVHGKKIKRIYVPPAQRDQLINGTLVVVNNDGLYHFVDKKVAEQIAQRDPRRIIVANADKPTELSEEDEYYAKFKVPDDLDW